MNCSSRCSPVSDVHIRLRAPARSRDGGVAGLWTEGARDPPAELKVWVDDYYDRGLIEMPLFKRATSIHLSMHRFDISLPPAGDFDQLEQLSLKTQRELLCEPQYLPFPSPATAQARDI